jgi:tetratricopeptide (TPR) repeat protein
MNFELIIRKTALLAIIIISLISATMGQTRRVTVPAGSTATIQGQVLLPGGQPIDRRIKISLSTLRDPGLSLYTDTNGQFTYDNLQPGNYSVEAMDDQNHYASGKEQIALTRGQQATIKIYLREKGESAEKKGDVVSAHSGDQQVPSEARREYEKATQLTRDGMPQEAIAHLQEAIALYPSYMMAHNDLGIAYLNLNQLQDAADQFGSAIDIDPKAFNPRLNLGIVFIHQGKHSEALDQLTQAVSIDSSQASGHLYIGIAYLGADNLETAERELMRALELGENQFRAAHYYLAHVHLKKGDSEKAVQELQAFLADATDPQLTESARQLLATLKHP